MIGTIEVDKKGNPISKPSLYSPKESVKKLTARVKQDYAIGHRILHDTHREFNNRSLIQVMNDDQRVFNAFVPAKSSNPDDAWRAQTVRPITRNKVISIAAHTTASLLYPNVFAQNEEDNQDKEAANVMRDLIEWVVKNSNYESSLLFGIISSLVNPAVILQADFNEVMQTIREKKNGKIVTREEIDYVLSGFSTNIIPVDELLITNVYEYEIQRQRALGRRRFIEYDEAKALWGEASNFKFVQPGVRAIHNETDGMFYEQKDDSLGTLVEEFTYYNRREDLQLTFVNGILVSDEDQPMKHRNYRGHPCYPFAKSGYEPIDERRFFYYKSCVSKLGPDQNLIDTLYNMVIDGSYLSLMPPLAVMGDEEVNSSVMFPGSVTNFNKETRIEPVNTGLNLTAGFNALQLVEKSMSETSQDDIRSGIPGPIGRTAYETARLEQNARIQLGLFGKLVAQMVKDYGYLLMDNILNHLTVAEVEEITAGETRLKWRSFLLADKVDEGNKVTRKIELNPEPFEEIYDDEDEENASFEVMEEEGGLDSDTRIYKVNPTLFRKLNFLLSVEADEMLPKNESFEKAFKLEAYDRMITNPLVDQKAVTRDFLLETFARGESSKYLSEDGNMHMRGMMAEQEDVPEEMATA